MWLWKKRDATTPIIEEEKPMKNQDPDVQIIHNQDPDVQIIYTVEEEELEDDVLNLFGVPLSCFGGDKNSPISVETYFDTVRLQTALLDSMSASEQHVISLSDDEESVEVVKISTWRNSKPMSRPSITETGESSSSKPGPVPIFCKICMEPKRPTEIFTVNECRHVFCTECISQHVAAKIQENTASVQCPEPGCKGVLEPIYCQPILPPDVFERWGSIMCESLILGSMKFYCPFKDCSGLLVDERVENGSVIVESECPHCRRLFCAKCRVPWHSGIGCDDFQKLGAHEREREDIMLMNLAKNKKWQRCPQCGFYVEKIEGCLFMKCRCRYCFCYRCAGPSDPTYHYCLKCGR